MAFSEAERHTSLATGQGYGQDVDVAAISVWIRTTPGDGLGDGGQEQIATCKSRWPLLSHASLIIVQVDGLTTGSL